MNTLSGLSKAAEALVEAHPEVFQKIALSLLANQLPSVSAALDAFQASRAQQAQIDAQRKAESFPALHATQANTFRAQQMAYGSDPAFW